MRAELDGMKNMTVCDTVVTIRSAVNAAAEAQMDALAEEIVRKSIGATRNTKAPVISGGSLLLYVSVL